MLNIFFCSSFARLFLLFPLTILIGDFADRQNIVTVLIVIIKLLLQKAISKFAKFDFHSFHSMKLFLFAVTIGLSMTSLSQSKDEAAVRNVLAKQNAAWNRGDIDAFMVGYWENDSLMFIGKSGVTYGYKNTLANYKKNYPDTTVMGKLTFTLIHVKQLSPDYFHVTGKYHLTRTIGDASGHFTLVFRKIKGTWVIISDHSS